MDTVGLDEEKIRKYVKYQEQKERQQEAQIAFKFLIFLGTTLRGPCGV